MRRFFTLLESTFKIHGYQVALDAALEGRSGTVYTAPLLAEKEGHALILDARLAGELVDAAAVADVQDVVADTGADVGLLCHLEEAAPDAHAGNEGSVVLWNRETLVRLLGEAALSEAVGTAPAPLDLAASPQDGALLAESVEDLLPDAFRSDGLTERLRHAVDQNLPPEPPQPEETVAVEPVFRVGTEVSRPEGEPDEPEDDAHADVPIAPVDQEAPVTHTPARAPEAAPDTHAPAPSTQATPAPGPAQEAAAPASAQPTAPTAPPQAPSQEPSSAAPPAPAAAPAGPSIPAFRHPLLPVLLPLEDAVRRCKDRLFRHSRSELLVHPVYLFDYECDLLSEGSLRYETERGRVQVDATRPVALEVDPLYVDPEVPTRLVPADGLGFAERQVRIEEDNAQHLAVEWIAKQHTRLVEVQVTDEDQSFAYSEKRRVQPRPEHVRLTLKGVFHRPVWRIIGVNGSIDVDAMTGQQVDENLRNPNPDVLMMD